MKLDENCFVCGMAVTWRESRLCPRCHAWAKPQRKGGYAVRWLHGMARVYPRLADALADTDGALMVKTSGSTNPLGHSGIAWLRAVESWPDQPLSEVARLRILVRDLKDLNVAQAAEIARLQDAGLRLAAESSTSEARKDAALHEVEQNLQTYRRSVAELLRRLPLDLGARANNSRLKVAIETRQLEQAGHRQPAEEQPELQVDAADDDQHDDDHEDDQGDEPANGDGQPVHDA